MGRMGLYGKVVYQKNNGLRSPQPLQVPSMFKSEIQFF